MATGSPRGQSRRFIVRGRKTSRLLWRHRVKTLRWVEYVVQHEPEAPRMVEKQERKNHREGDPDGELLVDRHVR
jgi:hypothetical protein